MTVPTDADFDQAEYLNRYAKIKSLMAERKLDAIIVSGELNYIYLTGHRSDQNKVDKARPYLVLLPLEGDPIVFTMGFERGHLESATWIREFRTYEFFRHNEAIESTLRELKLANGRIGWELGREQYLGMAVQDFLRLQASMSSAEFVDAADVLLEARSVKSPAEVEYIRQAASATSLALVNAFAQVKIGMTERDVQRLVAEAIAHEAGDGPTDMRVLSGKDHTGSRFNMFPTSRKLEPGDTLTVDTGVRVAGYACDIARTAVVGEPTAEQVKMQEFVYDLNHFCYSFLRPGLPCSEVARQCREELDRLGYEKLSVGRIGHGVGLDCLEYPSLREGEEIEIREGMVFACNPNFPLSFGYFNTEENLVVTPTGGQVLATPAATRELTVVG